MKRGTRALGVAESFGPDAERSTLCGAVVRADRVVDGFAYETCRVGGTDATEAIRSLFRELGREDVRHLLVAGVAPAWYNLVDLHTLHEVVGIPVLSVSFEESEGLEDALAREFDGEALARRLDTYRAQPPRRPVDVGDDRVFVRAVGCDDETAARVVSAHTPEGSGRPEPLRVARLAARAADDLRRTHDA
ncbi:DUF99 family protein [Halospeciosus flavus]|uniref:UPF0215 protein ACFQJ9_18070 n=1 Tax=Halospeciosus flavus TaxID=3032283 RepID=A0ABD5Z808_9EURY|nr:DUF99 family protein [Halospeciosus flavus]